MEKKFIDRKALKGDVGYLVMTRRVGEAISIGDDILITVVKVGPSQIRLGIYAPKTVNVCRAEVKEILHESEARNVREA